MRKLLRADFLRIKKSKSFWGGLVVLAGFALGIFFDFYRRVPRVYTTISLPEVLAECLFQHMILAGIVFSVFCSLFTGTEYEEGTIRNKLVTGQSRTSIYLSNYICCMTVSIFQAVVSVLLTLAVGTVLCGKPYMPAEQFLWLFVILLFLCMAYASIYNLCGMLISSKSHASMANVLLAVAFIVLASYLVMKLGQPETVPQVSITGDTITYGEEIPNPSYVKGIQREIYQFLTDFLPGGQSCQISISSLQNQILRHPALSCCYSAIIIIAANLTGIFMFRRKDIK